MYNWDNKTKQRTVWRAYKATFNKYNSVIQNAKRKSWVCFADSIENVNDAARFRKVLSKDPKPLGIIRGEVNARDYISPPLNFEPLDIHILDRKF